MRALFSLVLLVGFIAPASGQKLTDRRPVATYSIVARDSATGQLGVAVQSHWFSVGPIVAWAEAGVGAVATQSFIDPSYGPLGLAMMRAGRSAPDALAGLLRADADREVRQVAMIDAAGRVQAHTGNRAIQAAGQHVGKQYSVQANLMENPTVWDAMARAYETAEGDLAERLLKALEAAEGEGGDIRGRQSAAILVVSGTPTGRSWEDRIFDLRVEDNPDPVAELRRLVRMQRAYLKLNEGDGWVTQGNFPKALEAYSDAMDILPDEATNGESPFWVGVTLLDAGDADQALPYLQRAYRQDPRWADLIPRLPAAGLLKADPATIERLVQAMQR
ncbi:MAG: DUF1028 domain-containing protein [Rhodothermales bacterium]